MAFLISDSFFNVLLVLTIFTHLSKSVWFTQSIEWLDITDGVHYSLPLYLYVMNIICHTLAERLSV